MVAKVLGLGRSFTRLAAYRLEKDERVDWADTRNLRRSIRDGLRG